MPEKGGQTASDADRRRFASPEPRSRPISPDWTRRRTDQRTPIFMQAGLTAKATGPMGAATPKFFPDSVRNSLNRSPAVMSVSSPHALTATLAQERPQDDSQVQALVERAFGPGRFAKSAERLREGNQPDLALSFVAWAGEKAVGCIRLWPVQIGPEPAFLLGPFAVDDAWRSQGLGGALVERACQAVQARGRGLVVLVGDEPFFRRF